MLKRLTNLLITAAMLSSFTATPLLAKTSFGDIDPEAYYAKALTYCVENEVLKGKNETTFGPEDFMSRGQMITAIYRAEGSPESLFQSGFKDVDPEAYYGPAVNWAAENGIVHGYDQDHFGPMDALSREQMAVMLKNYSDYNGYPDTSALDLSKFSDAAAVSEFAKEAMAWAVGQNVITGKANGTLDPQALTNRAEAATMLYRFLSGNDHFASSLDHPEGYIPGETGNMRGKGLLAVGIDHVLGIQENRKVKKPETAAMEKPPAADSTT